MTEFVNVLPPDSDVPQRVPRVTFDGVYEARGFTLIDEGEAPKERRGRAPSRRATKTSEAAVADEESTTAPEEE